MVAATVEDMASTLALRQRRLQRVDRAGCRPDRRRAGPPRRSTRDRRAAPATRAARRATSPRARTRSTGSAPAAAISAVSSARSALRGCASASSSDTYEKRPSSRAAAQPTTSLWSASGSTDANAGSAAFSLNWHFQRYAAAAASSAPAITGTVPCSARAIVLRLARRRSGPPLGGERLGQVRGRLDLVAHRRRGAGQRRRLQRRHQRVADRRPRLEAARASGSPARRRAARARPAARRSWPRAAARRARAASS